MAMKPARFVWSAIDEQVLRDTYAHVPTANIARSLGLPAHKVQAKARRMGLAKSHECKADMARMVLLTTPGHGANRWQFKPGIVPWNTGTKGLSGQADGCRRTQFKPGSKPHTTMPIGAYRMGQDGVLERKFSDEPGAPNLRWRSAHSLLWIEAHGPIPEGHVVAFKPGMATVDPDLITLDRIELVTRAEMMRRNSIHQMPPELADVARLRGRLSRAIHQVEKDSAP